MLYKLDFYETYYGLSIELNTWCHGGGRRGKGREKVTIDWFDSHELNWKSHNQE